MRREFFTLSNANETQRSSATLSGISGRMNGRRKQMAQVNPKIVLFLNRQHNQTAACTARTAVAGNQGQNVVIRTDCRA